MRQSYPNISEALPPRDRVVMIDIIDDNLVLYEDLKRYEPDYLLSWLINVADQERNSTLAPDEDRTKAFREWIDQETHYGMLERDINGFRKILVESLILKEKGK